MLVCWLKKSATFGSMIQRKRTSCWLTAVTFTVHFESIYPLKMSTTTCSMPNYLAKTISVVVTLLFVLFNNLVCIALNGVKMNWRRTKSLFIYFHWSKGCCLWERYNRQWLSLYMKIGQMGRLSCWGLKMPGKVLSFKLFVRTSSRIIWRFWMRGKGLLSNSFLLRNSNLENHHKIFLYNSRVDKLLSTFLIESSITRWKWLGYSDWMFKLLLRFIRMRFKLIKMKVDKPK